MYIIHSNFFYDLWGGNFWVVVIVKSLVNRQTKLLNCSSLSCSQSGARSFLWPNYWLWLQLKSFHPRRDKNIFRGGVHILRFKMHRTNWNHLSLPFFNEIFWGGGRVHFKYIKYVKYLLYNMFMFIIYIIYVYYIYYIAI